MEGFAQVTQHVLTLRQTAKGRDVAKLLTYEAFNGNNLPTIVVKTASRNSRSGGTGSCANLTNAHVAELSEESMGKRASKYWSEAAQHLRIIKSYGAKSRHCGRDNLYRSRNKKWPATLILKPKLRTKRGTGVDLINMEIGRKRQSHPSKGYGYCRSGCDPWCVPDFCCSPCTYYSLDGI